MPLLSTLSSVWENTASWLSEFRDNINETADKLVEISRVTDPNDASKTRLRADIAVIHSNRLPTWRELGRGAAVFPYKTSTAIGYAGVALWDLVKAGWHVSCTPVTTFRRLIALPKETKIVWNLPAGNTDPQLVSAKDMLKMAWADNRTDALDTLKDDALEHAKRAGKDALKAGAALGTAAVGAVAVGGAVLGIGAEFIAGGTHHVIKQTRDWSEQDSTAKSWGAGIGGFFAGLIRFPYYGGKAAANTSWDIGKRTVAEGPQGFIKGTIDNCKLAYYNATHWFAKRKTNNELSPQELDAKAEKEQIKAARPFPQPTITGYRKFTEFALRRDNAANNAVQR